ncbi:hypothetical protein L2E82_48372 [Cichorium intybus]|uniref:Uncharacterized protein n=1 Tax=Cichorium intybus TaxID=13427 RepID=A0ACB8YY83_CICIN|nr:hypothetical protein L2E82_48372 [Cichorium intybus]
MSDVVNTLETALGYQHGAGPRLLNNKPDSRRSGADTWFERIRAKRTAINFIYLNSFWMAIIFLSSNVECE